MAAFEFDPEDPDDRGLIVAFLQQLHRFLLQLALEPMSVSPAIRYVPEAQAHMRDMWSDIPLHYQRTDMTIRETPRDILASAGLAGPHLRGKLAVLQHWAARLAATPIISILIKLLANINSILGSLIQATGTGEVIKEFKEFLENAIDDLQKD